MDFVAVWDALKAAFTMVYAIATLLGVGIAVNALVKIRRLGMREFQAYPRWRETPLGIFSDFLVGVALSYIATTSLTVHQTIFGGSSDIQFAHWPDITQSPAPLALILVRYVQLIGFVALIRGVMMLGELGEDRGQGSPGAKAATLIISGAMGMNLPGTAEAIGTLMPLNVLSTIAAVGGV